MHRFSEIADRVNASMCMSYGSQHPNGRMEARITKDDWDALCGMIQFYARHEHWMSLGEDGPQVLLIAQGNVPGADGWAMAEGGTSPIPTN